MSSRIEQLIEQCTKGGAAQDIIKEIEEELPDVKSIHHNLQRDLKYAGINIPMSSIHFKQDYCQVSIPPQLIPSKSIIESVLDVYNNTYPELEFFTI